jgi:hypothetical protein
MDIQSTKIELAKMILNLESPSIVNKIIALIKSEQSDFWMELSEEDKAEINLGIEQLDAGQRISFDNFMKKVS